MSGFHVIAFGVGEGSVWNRFYGVTGRNWESHVLSGAYHQFYPQFVTTVQPFPSRETFAASPVALGAAEVPPSMFTVPLLWPAVSRETRMLSTLVWSRAQLVQAWVKFVAAQVSNIPAGKEVRLVQFSQVCAKIVPLLTSSKGKEVKLAQLNQAAPKSVPLLISSMGKEVRFRQPNQAELKLVPLLTFNRGKEVRLEQFRQV